MEYFSLTVLINAMSIFKSKIQDNEKNWVMMIVRKQEQRVEVFTLPTTFCMEWVDSNPIPWTPYDNSFADNPAIFSFHTHYGVHIEWTIMQLESSPQRVY